MLETMHLGRSLGIGQPLALLEQLLLDGDRLGRVGGVDQLPDLPFLIALRIGKVGLHGLRDLDAAVGVAPPEDVDVVAQA
jgi:hypothetical protein